MWNAPNPPTSPRQGAALGVPPELRPCLHPCLHRDLPVTPASATAGALGPPVNHFSFHSLRFINRVIRLMIINACKGLYALQLEGDSEG